jgi:signal peptide peptidase SppA
MIEAHRAKFRTQAIPGEALAIDPGAGGLIHAAIRGAQPSPHAFGFYYDVPRRLEFVPEEYTDAEGNVVPSTLDGNVAVLCIQGPLEHHDHGMSWGPHSYECLVEEIECALDHGEVKAVAIKIDSPGGVAAGMNETHRAIRRLREEYHKPIYAFADEMACSAAYHLASACTEVWTTPEGHLGSIGVILCTIDESRALDKQGIAIRYVVSGERKADLHPGTAVTDDVLEVAQAKVDKLARHFFREVGDARGKRGLTAEKAQALQASVKIGNDAVRARLADGIASWNQFLGLVKSTVKGRSGDVGPKDVAQAARGAAGARARMEKTTAEERSKSARKAAYARWNSAHAKPLRSPDS